jgi:hypothetical protein
MLSKWKIELIAFLASLSLISVGFSSWNISYTVPVIETISGTVQTDYVLKTDDYVYFADGDITLPTYVQDGFITQNAQGIYELSNVGKLKLVFTIDYEKCNGLNDNVSALKQNGDIYIDIDCIISLKNNATTFFSQNTFSVTGYNSGLTTGYTYSEITNSSGYSLSITNYPYTQLTEDGKIEVTFSITTTNKANVYSLLNGNSFTFETKVQGHK